MDKQPECRWCGSEDHDSERCPRVAAFEFYSLDLNGGLKRVEFHPPCDDEDDAPEPVAVLPPSRPHLIAEMPPSAPETLPEMPFPRSVPPTELSERERQILRALSDGSPNKVIARQCAITEATVKVHLKAILRKLRVANRTQAAIWAYQNTSAMAATG